MKRRERVLRALRFQQPDVTPWHISLTAPAFEKVAAHFGTRNVDDALGNHLAIISSQPPELWTETKPGFFRDEFGVIWDRTVDTDIGTTFKYQLTEPSLANYFWPDPGNSRRFRHFNEEISAGGDRFIVGDVGFSLFERAWTLRGMENVLMDMVINEAFADKLFDTICEWYLKMVRRMLEFPFDALFFGDDWGSQRGLIMGPALWRRFIKPRIARLYAAVRDAGRIVMIHSCGDVDEIFPDLIELGVNVFNPFQPEVMDTFALAKKYKGSLAFFGGISTQKLLPYGTPDEVRTSVRDIVARIGAGGGYIAAPAHDTPKDVPLENILAMHEVLAGQ